MTDINKWYKRNKDYIEDIFDKLIYTLRNQKLKVSENVIYKNFIEFAFQNSNKKI